MLDPKEYVITRRRKKYKFAQFTNSPLCFEEDEWRAALPARPTIVEVGAGTAQFSVGMAQAFPEAVFGVFDVKADRLITGARQAEEAGLKNIFFIRSHAEKILELCTPGSVEAIWLTFPDPYPKKRAAKHRLTHKRFLDVYTPLLSTTGALYFKTDNHDLFDWSLESLVANGWRFDQLSFDLHEADLPAHYKIITAYEQRYLDENAKICFVRAVPPKEDTLR